MIKHIMRMPYTEEWCNHCKRHCFPEEREAFLISSDQPKVNDIILCKACLDLALSEQGILPEDF